MFDSPTSSSHIVASFAHHSTNDSSGTIRRHPTSMRLSVTANAKRIYDEVIDVDFLVSSLIELFEGIDGEKSQNLFEQC